MFGGGELDAPEWMWGQRGCCVSDSCWARRKNNTNSAVANGFHSRGPKSWTDRTILYMFSFMQYCMTGHVKNEWNMPDNMDVLVAWDTPPDWPTLRPCRSRIVPSSSPPGGRSGRESASALPPLSMKVNCQLSSGPLVARPRFHPRSVAAHRGAFSVRSAPMGALLGDPARRSSTAQTKVRGSPG